MLTKNDAITPRQDLGKKLVQRAFCIRGGFLGGGKYSGIIIKGHKGETFQEVIEKFVIPSTLLIR